MLKDEDRIFTNLYGMYDRIPAIEQKDEFVVDLTRALDPTRPVNTTSGFLHVITDIWTVHDYSQSGDTLRERESLDQERLTGFVRAFVPTLRRQTFVAGLDGAVLQSNAYDEADLFRLGGATSLRGYDEDRFRGRLTARTLAEYRYLLDRRSYAFVFFDLGYVETPELGEAEARRELFPGYGFGVQFATDLGLVVASYAVNPEDGFAQGRVHAGLSFGL